MEDHDNKKRLVDGVCRELSDIETRLKILKLVPNQIYPNGILLFSDEDVRFLLQTAAELDSNQFQTNVGLTIGSSLGVAGNLLSIAGLSAASGGIGGALVGVGLGMSIAGGTANVASTVSRNEVQKSCASNISPALQKFCLISHILQGTIYCYAPFLSNLQHGKKSIREHLGELDLSQLQKVYKIATKIKEGVSNNTYQATLENVFFIADAAKSFVRMVYGGIDNWIDPQDEKQILEVIAAMTSFAMVNDIKSLKRITASMATVRIFGSIALGMSAKYTKAATVAVSAATKSATDAAKLATNMRVASIALNAAGAILDAAVLAGTVYNMLNKSQSELSETLRDIAATIKLFMEIKDF